MEEDSEDISLPSSGVVLQARTTQDIMDLNALFALLKDHITEATQQLSGEVYHIVDANAKFKQDGKEELDEMHKVLAEQKRLLNITQTSSSFTQATLVPISTVGTTITPAPNSTTGQTPPVPVLTTLASPPPFSTQDIQSQMLMMLTDSFSKLSTVLSEKSESKSDWPKFSGDAKKF